MINIYVKEIGGKWFGLAYAMEKIVATTINSSKEGATRSLVRNTPLNVKHQIVEVSSEFTEKAMHMMKELESGNEGFKEFSLADEYIHESTAKILKAAAAVPIGYVTSYGNIAEVSETEPRTVGRIMATNPLYPIVPCHRVVGSDFSLVGYGGRKNLSALKAKLLRLSKEAKGFIKNKGILVDMRILTVYPVERVITKARKQNLAFFQQQLLLAKDEESETCEKT